jgi:hypothetical protein
VSGGIQRFDPGTPQRLAQAPSFVERSRWPPGVRGGS